MKDGFPGQPAGADRADQAHAQIVADEAAPAPVGSAVMFGSMAVVLFVVAAWGAGKFYDVDLSPHWIIGLILSMSIFALGMLERRRRMLRHRSAFRDALVERRADRQPQRSMF